MTIRIRLPGGTLKIKHYVELRPEERARKVPVFRYRRICFIWWKR